VFQRPRSEGDESALSSRETEWAEIFRTLDEAGVPEDFLEDRDLRPPEEPVWLEEEGEGVNPASSAGT
jgi:hypothetical protein